MGLVFLAPPLSAQQIFDQFSYEGLRFSGIGVEFGAVGSNRLTAEPTGAVRVDYGYIAPNIRLLFGLAYFKGDFDSESIAEFETRLRGVVDDPTGDFAIDVGTISLADLEASLDLQYVAPFTNRVVPYIGLGIAIHFRNGSGTAIDGTFVDDALDTIAAAGTVSAGTHLALAGPVFLTADLRAALSSELRTLTGRGGLMIRVPRRTTP